MDFLAKKLIKKIGGSDSFQNWVGLNIPTEFERSSGIWVTKAGLRQFGEGFQYDPASGKTHYEWGAVIEGEMELTVNGTTIILKEGMYYCMPDSYRFSAKSLVPSILIWFEGNGPLCGQLFSMLTKGSNQPVVAKYNYDHLKHSINIAYLLHHRPLNHTMQIYTALWNFFSAFYPQEKVPDGQLQTVIHYIHSNAHDHTINLEKLAQVIYMSPETFRKKFTNQVGKSPMQYVLQTRITLAKEMLCDSKKTIRQIAFDCGFSDPYYFSRVFKESEGLSPKHFRKETTFKSL